VSIKRSLVPLVYSFVFVFAGFPGCSMDLVSDSPAGLCSQALSGIKTPLHVLCRLVSILCFLRLMPISHEFLQVHGQ